MKKGSSGNRKRPPQKQTPASRYPTRDNVYSLQQERQKRQGSQRGKQQRYQETYRPAEEQPVPKKRIRKEKMAI